MSTCAKLQDRCAGMVERQFQGMVKLNCKGFGCSTASMACVWGGGTSHTPTSCQHGYPVGLQPGEIEMQGCRGWSVGQDPNLRVDKGRACWTQGLSRHKVCSAESSVQPACPTKQMQQVALPAASPCSLPLFWIPALLHTVCQLSLFAHAVPGTRGAPGCPQPAGWHQCPPRE